MPLNRTGRTWISVPRFTRYVGWSLAGRLDSEAIATVNIVAKP